MRPRCNLVCQHVCKQTVCNESSRSGASTGRERSLTAGSRARGNRAPQACVAVRRRGCTMRTPESGRRANANLKDASVYFATVLDRPACEIELLDQPHRWGLQGRTPGQARRDRRDRCPRSAVRRRRLRDEHPVLDVARPRLRLLRDGTSSPSFSASRRSWPPFWARAAEADVALEETRD